MSEMQMKDTCWCFTLGYSMCNEPMPKYKSCCLSSLCRVWLRFAGEQLSLTTRTTWRASWRCRLKRRPTCSTMPEPRGGTLYLCVCWHLYECVWIWICLCEWREEGVSSSQVSLVLNWSLVLALIFYNMIVWVPPLCMTQNWCSISTFTVYGLDCLVSDWNTITPVLLLIEKKIKTFFHWYGCLFCHLYSSQ